MIFKQLDHNITVVILNRIEGARVKRRSDFIPCRVLQTMREGDGLRLMSESGVFRFRIDAEETNWTVKVIQLNRDEAKLYTPKR